MSSPAKSWDNIRGVTISATSINSKPDAIKTLNPLREIKRNPKSMNSKSFLFTLAYALRIDIDTIRVVIIKIKLNNKKIKRFILSPMIGQLLSFLQEILGLQPAKSLLHLLVELF